MRVTAREHGAILVDLAELLVLQDRRMWHADRLHLNPAGHARVAGATLNAIERPADELEAWWGAPLPPERRSRVQDSIADCSWLVRHFSPWVLRRLRGVSSGDGVEAKQSQLMSLK